MTIEAYKSQGTKRLLAPVWRLWRFATSGTFLSLADQGAVSGLAFAIVMITGTYAGFEELGAFSLAMSLIALALAIQDALITRPYTVQMHTKSIDGQAHLDAIYKLSVGFAGTMLLLCLGGGIAIKSAGYDVVGTMAFALALAMPGILLREFGRRVSFAHERSIEALIIDAPTAITTLTVILIVGHMGELTAARALLVLGAANLVAAASWTLVKGLNRGFVRTPVAKVAGNSWLVGRWLLLCQLAMQAQGYTTHWLALAFLGPGATGTYAACLSIVALANPVLFGLFNVLWPRSARAFHNKGVNGVISRALHDAALLSVIMLCFTVIIAVFGAWLMNQLFPGLGDTRHLLVVLSASLLVGTAGVPAAMALTSTNHTAKLAPVVIASAVINLAVMITILPWGGLLGAAYGMVFGEAVGTAGRWIALYWAIGSGPAAAPSHSSEE